MIINSLIDKIMLLTNNEKTVLLHFKNADEFTVPAIKIIEPVLLQMCNKLASKKLLILSPIMQLESGDFEYSCKITEAGKNFIRKMKNQD